MSSLVTAQHAEELSTGARQLGVALTQTQHELLLGYLALSGWTYVMYMHDKTAAELGEWRVSEGGLHLLGLLGGWPGANLAQHFLRHKSKKTSFRVKHWVMVCLNLGVFAFMASNGMLRLEY